MPLSDYRPDKREFFFRPVWSMALLLCAASPAWSIPSPDLVIGLSASVAQVLGLVSVLFTGLAISGRGKAGRMAVEKRSTRSRFWRWSFRLFIVLLFVSIGANLLQHTSAIDEKNRRLQTNLVRSSVEAGKSVGDTSLKTLKLSDQIGHPLGIENTQLAKWIEEGQPLNLIDVREPEEVAMGRIEGAWHRRYPDLRENSANLIQNGKKTVLLCYSGNRSSELCNEFSKEGKACNFVVGGYEKWLADGYPLKFSRDENVEELRDLLDYPNRDVLLDTTEVQELVKERDIQFVDVRYPADFALDHLPGAINLPVRKLPSAELIEGLTSLPSKPVVAPCYDKRSCFYGKILGSRLTELGYEYLGRYTVPHEFFLPVSGEAPEDFTVLGMISAPLTAGLQYLTETTGRFSVAILLLVMVLRLVTLPLTWKSERDRLVQRALKPHIEKLKQRITDDPPRLSKATVKLYRRKKLTPVRNLIGSIAQLTLFLVFFSVVNTSAANWDSPFLWLANASSEDPSYVLPALVTMLFAAYMVFTASRRSGKFLLMYAAGGGLIWLLTHQLNAAVNLYLVINVSLLFFQSLMFKLLWREAPDQTMPPVAQVAETGLIDPGVISLAEAHSYPSAGHKATRLSLLMQNGLPVPDGFVVTSKVLTRPNPEGVEEQFSMTSDERSLLSQHWKRLGSDSVAVRSSGLNEDGASQSYAGVFESILNVSQQGLVEALLKVRLSMCSQRSSAYSGETEEKGGALVQTMVNASYAGVLFTEDPNSAGCSMVEMVSGLGESLVSGKVTPESYTFGVRSRRSMDGKTAPIDLTPLLEMGQRVEHLFGKPQDIEWVYVDGRFLLVQARDITTSVHNRPGIDAAFERERIRLLKLAPKNTSMSDVFLAQNELSELLPRPTPLSSSLMERLWCSGGSTDLACRSLGIPYDVEDDSAPYVNPVFGALYVNRFEERSRLRRPPGAMSAFWLARNGETIESDFREGFLPGFLNEMRLQEVLDFEQLSTEQLIALNRDWTLSFIKGTYVQAEVINVATEFYWKTACAKLERKSIDPAQYLGQIPATVVQQAMSLLTRRENREEAIREFLDLFGHRAPQDYELSQPRYRENPQLVIKQMMCTPASSVTHSAGGSMPSDPVLRLAVDRARRFQVLKEEAKHQCLRQLALIRKLLLALDRRLELYEGIFYLNLDELLEMHEKPMTETLRLQIAARMDEAKAWRELHLPSELSVVDLEGLTMAGGVKDSGEQSTGALQGKRVAGTGDVVGKVHVIHSAEEIEHFKKGDIVVARFTDPTWYPLFPIAGGIITEVGGWLSHAAIVAREQNLTAIVGVKAASARLKTGQLVKLCIDGTVEVLEEKRACDSPLRVPKRVDPIESLELGKQAVGFDAMVTQTASGGSVE